jgi:hypothetical protein
MPRRQVFHSPEQLGQLILELSQELGPDHSRVKRLKADLSRRLAQKKAAPYPASAQTADQLNKVIDAERGALEAERRAAAAATLNERTEAANFMAAVYAGVAKQQKRDKS